MLKKHSKFFENILFIADLVIIALSWLFSYYLRFETALIPIDKGRPPVIVYIILLVPITIIWGFVFKGFGLYRPKRTGSHLSEVFDIAKATFTALLILVAVTFFLKHYDVSRLVMIFFTVIVISSLSIERVVFRSALRYLRRKGYNLRYAIIVGTGPQAERIVKSLERHPEVGLKLEGLITTREPETGKRIAGLPVLAACKDLKRIIREKRIDKVFIALSWEEHPKFVDVLNNLQYEAIDIKVIPDIYEFITLRGGVEEFDGMPILNLQNSPLYGWNLVLKRIADVTFSILALVLLSPLMVLVALLIKLTSPGPVFYRQERMGIGGDTFQILKFRSMRADAESETGAVWAQKDDPRRTGLGTFLRKTSMDELPQFFNVLKGDMSIVGPRPERPVFIREFRENVPKYMLRHTMKAGITGWAQINGWRGNTDIGKRVEHDLYYIENWSLTLDIKILWLTIWKGLVNRNAY